ncbi:uncharacterized protein [Polyergus mexicanus]|uniref:uncharacterized protein n=1 Tax=Polyergus mexicanus TaxID=615972 RepID=UPI0038B6A61B
MNGGILIEIPRPVRAREEDPEPPTSAELADRLAESLRGVLEGTGVRVARPTKFAEMRLRGLDSSVTLGEAREALMALGGLGGGDLRVGEIRRFSSGPGTMWVRAPAVFIRRLAVAGRVRVGWTWAQVEVLRARPLQCFRCLAIGHVRQRCTGGEDRSGLCYRCGKPGHLAARCEGTPNCPICSGLGLPAKHRLGVGV